MSYFQQLNLATLPSIIRLTVPTNQSRSDRRRVRDDDLQGSLPVLILRLQQLEIPRKVKMAAAHEDKTVKEFLMELARTRIEELEWKGILPKSKG